MVHGENKIYRGEPAMSIEKKSLISTLKTTKKANAVKDDISGAATTSPAQKMPNVKHANVKHANVKHANVKHANLKHANVKHANVKHAVVKAL
jgi:uncharacterized protein YjbI with pentapeptide repeats